MAAVRDEITDELAAWMGDQHVFFVATAPNGPEGHVNVSPKGYDSFRVLGRHRVAYLDLTGSGAETIAHLRENGRITIMFCAFAGRPRIARFHGTGRVLFPGDDGFEDLAGHFDDLAGRRAVIDVDVERISTSCGYAVPFMEYAGERPTLTEWAERKGPDGVHTYHGEKNRRSIDGLPALEGTQMVERDQAVSADPVGDGAT